MSATRRFFYATFCKSVQAALAVGTLLAAAPAEAREYFVSSDGVDKNNTEGSESEPFLTIQKAADLTLPGDVVTVKDGTYSNASPNGNVVSIKRSGTDKAGITYRAFPGHTPKLKFTGWNGIGISNGASYIEIKGFEVEGSIKDTTLEHCTAQKDVADPLCNGGGISIDGRNDGLKKPHHIYIHDNEVHHCAGGGISGIAADYITIEHNKVHDNSWYTRYGTSGISILTPWNFDNSTGYRIFIQQNTVWNNKTQVPWEQIKKLSDGNGIILDTFKGTDQNSPPAPYGGRTLVQNNVSFNNGGSGIHAYKSVHVDIINNTAFKNGQVVGYADIFAGDSDDVTILNNVMYARPTGNVNSKPQGSNVVFDYNVYFGGLTPAVKGTHDRVLDPKFVDPTKGDFRPTEGSPLIDTAATTLAPKDDLIGTKRPQRKGPDVGAFELPAGTGQKPTALAADTIDNTDLGKTADPNDYRAGEQTDNQANDQADKTDGGVSSEAGCSYGAAPVSSTGLGALVALVGLAFLRRRQS